jgi:small subunit ribosomal protein S16
LIPPEVAVSVHIRLRRQGKRKQPTYRLVVADSRAPRDGRFIEAIGHYDPRREPVELVVDVERAKHWFGAGAKPTETARDLLVKAGIPDSEVPPIVR